MPDCPPPDAGRMLVRVMFGAGVAGVGAFIGYLIGSRKKQQQKCGEALVKYAIDNSLRLTPVQGRLIAATKQHPTSHLLSAPDLVQTLQIIVKSIKAKKALDIGVYTGYSTMSIAMALPGDGKVIGLEWDDTGPTIGKPFWQEAGVTPIIDLRMGPAVQSLQALVDGGEVDTFDFALIDGDKENYLNYFEYCMKLVRPGGIIACNKVLVDGIVLDASQQNNDTSCIHHFNRTVAKDTRIDLIMLNLGEGLTLAMKK